MKPLTLAALCVSAVALVACDTGGDMGGPETALDDPAWDVLFAGQDLASFNEIGGGNWRLENGAVMADDGEPPGFLVTAGAYTDFHIRVELQASSETNSGIFIRCADPNVVSAEECYEINVFDQNTNPANRTGAIVNHQGPLESVMAGDAWNTFDITAEGAHLTVRVNDIVTADYTDPENEHSSGYIGLQYNGGPIRFRDVRIRPL
jgi:hypothetical protein